MKSIKCNKNSRSGAILPIMMCIILLMMLIGLSVTSLGFYSRLLPIKTASNITARCAADSGVNEAVFEMNEKLKVKPWDKSNFPAGSEILQQDSNASFDYIVSESNDVYSVQSTGHAGNSTHSIHSTLRLGSPFDYALLARKSIEFKNSAKLDWLNNKSNDWLPRIGTCSIASGAIVLMNGSVINGDIMVGVGGEPDEVLTTKTGVTITGGAYTLTSEPDLPTVSVPVSVAGASSQGKINTTRVISTSGKYDEINLGNSAVLTINKSVTLYITGKVILGTNSKILISGTSESGNDASLTMYVGGDISAGNSIGIVNNTKDARRFKLFCLPTCQKAVIKNAGDFYGLIYAPDTAVTYDNGANTYGSMIADSFILKNSGTFFYDANLRNCTLYDELVRFTIGRWSED
jgi:hypothetical protein